MTEHSMPLYASSADGSVDRTERPPSRVMESVLLVLDERGTVLNAASAGGSILGYVIEDITGADYSLFFTEGERQSGLPARLLADASSGGRAQCAGRQRWKDGGEFAARLTVDAIHNGAGGLVGFAVAIVSGENGPEEKATRILVQSQKMDAIGQLASSVAHDFNNLLTVIINSLDFLARAKHDDRGQRLIGSAREAADRGARLTQQLLAFSRRQPLKPEIRNPNELIAGFEEILRRACGEAITLTFSLSADVGPVAIDRTQFETALLNLAVNARDAMPDGGSLAISTRKLTIDPALQQTVRERGCVSDLCPVNGRSRFQVRGSHTAPVSIQSGCAMKDLEGGSYIMVSVKDSGSGIPADVLARIFEPFFSTKEIGRGTGLGLSQVYGFIAQSKGHIAIDSLPGRGTVVRFYLPQAVGGTEGGTGEQEEDEGVQHGGTVLIVEDEAAVREMAARLFVSLDFAVRVAPDGPAALQILDSHPDIDVLFSDIVMPNGVNGIDLARRARALRPSLKVILASGYPSAGSSPLGNDPFITFIEKPYRRSDLVRKLDAFARLPDL